MKGYVFVNGHGLCEFRSYEGVSQFGERLYKGQIKLPAGVFEVEEERWTKWAHYFNDFHIFETPEQAIESIKGRYLKAGSCSQSAGSPALTIPSREPLDIAKYKKQSEEAVYNMIEHEIWNRARYGYRELVVPKPLEELFTRETFDWLRASKINYKEEEMHSSPYSRNGKPVVHFVLMW